MDSKTIWENLKNKETWSRLIYMVLFVIAFQLVEALLFTIMIVQFFAQIFTGKPLDRVTEFGSNLGKYAKQIICFLTFSEDTTPWPLASWPSQSSQEQSGIDDNS